MSQEILNPENISNLKKAEIEAEYAKLHAAYKTATESGIDEVVKKQLAAKDAEIAELKAKLESNDADELVKVIDEQNKKLAALEKAAQLSGAAKVVEHDGVFYKVALPKVNVDGTIYTAEQLCQPENAEVRAKLIEIGSGALVAQKEA